MLFALLPVLFVAAASVLFLVTVGLILFVVKRTGRSGPGQYRQPPHGYHPHQRYGHPGQHPPQAPGQYGHPEQHPGAQGQQGRYPTQYGHPEQHPPQAPSPGHHPGAHESGQQDPHQQDPGQQDPQSPQS